MSVFINYDGLRIRGAKIAKVFDSFLQGHTITASDIASSLELYDDGKVICRFCLPLKGDGSKSVSYRTPSAFCDIPLGMPTPEEFVNWMCLRSPENLALMRKVVDAFREYNRFNGATDVCLDDPEALYATLIAGRKRKMGCLIPLSAILVTTVSCLAFAVSKM